MRELALVLLAAFTLGARAQPNLVAILIDDMGWRDAGFTGNNAVRTPNMDRLARSGIIFTRAYAAAPNCAPTRACLMTGQYTPRHGVFTVVDERFDQGQPNQRIIPSSSKPELDGAAATIAELLKDAGYDTGMVGMWNLGKGRKGPRVPTGQGFDCYIQPKDLGFERDQYFNAQREYLTDRLTDKAIEYVRECRRPFFLYLAYHAVHAPFDPKPELLAANGGDEYLATIEALDQNIGRLAEALPKDTVVVFTSDNGGTFKFIAPLSGGKGTLYEGGLRVPAFACGAGIDAGLKTDEPISTIDLCPTLLELAGVEAPADLAIDGKSLVPLWNGQSLNRDTLYWHFPCYVGRGKPSSALLKDGRYKLIEFFEDSHIELYDLSTDPSERDNLAGTNPTLAAKLHGELRAWQDALGAPRPSTPNPKFDPNAIKPENLS